ncbi:glycosyltransferase 87 family protein [Rhodococcus sp. NPDC049939]|uniref:glycosyltransferase 87 family protein n=1 Tax=Rhodococcus sp. NPDC049939 TaxID=3155511 RepID=UPI0033C77271
MRLTSDGRYPAILVTDSVDAPPAPPHLRIGWFAVRVLILAGLAVGFTYNLLGLPGFRDFGHYYRLDLDVYRLGGSVFLDGSTLYGSMPPIQMGNFLPFTYPPFAAMVFSPLATMSLATAGTVVTTLSLIALLGVLAVTLDSLGIGPRKTLAWTAMGMLAVSMALEPVYSTLDYGQINIVLMALVVADCLPRQTPWPRGLLIGLAAAIKLTPGIFVIYLLARKDFRASMVALISFAAFAAVGAIAAWRDSITYWTQALFDSHRIGAPAYPANQSITGVLARLGLSDPARTAIWLLLCAVVLTLTLVAMVRALRSGETTLALGLNAILGLLASPVSWSHHWVWSTLVVFVLGILSYRRRSIALAITALSGLVVFMSAAHWKLGAGRWSGTHWNLWDQFLASSYVWWALAVVLVTIFSFRARPSQSGDDRSRNLSDSTVPVG